MKVRVVLSLCVGREGWVDVCRTALRVENRIVEAISRLRSSRCQALYSTPDRLVDSLGSVNGIEKLSYPDFVAAGRCGV